VSRNPEALPTSAFEYELPVERIAQYPSERRDESRLLVLHRASGAIEHRRFRNVLDYMNAGDVLAVNETRVIPARLLGRKTTGARVEVLLIRPVEWDAPADAATASPPRRESAAGAASLYWEAMVRPGGKLKPGRVVEIAPELIVEIIERTRDGNRIVRLDSTLPIEQAISRFGRTPLPPYVEREDSPADRERYQTVYARRPGSVAAPTAGLHFTPALLAAIEAKGVAIARLVLHVGIGTFRPVEVDDPGAHVMHRERFDVPAGAAELMNAARARGSSVWAVGTTVVRTIEATTDDAGITRSGSGETALFIRPPYRFRGVDRLITNFHLPRSTLLMLVAAFGGYDGVMKAYSEAVAGEYRFYSFGDAMAVL
jgi:S-adenosylmethionine:tRNA ribosyltransferase-isomerase